MSNPVLENQLKKIQDRFGSSIVKIEYDRAGCPVLWTKKDDAIELLDFLKTAAGLDFIFLADLTAYDELGSKEESLSRFVVVYNLYSPEHGTRLRVKARLQLDEPMPTAVGVWSGANWAEREVYDMFGIRFAGHPDLRRILLDIRWEGHPLRKDYYWRKSQIFTDAEPIPEHLLKD